MQANGGAPMKAILYSVSIPFLCVFIVSMTRAQEKTVPTRQLVNVQAFNVTVSNLGKDINSSDDDFAPFLMGNGHFMFLTSTRTGNQNVFTTSYSGTAWDSPVEIGPTINTSNDEGSTSITPDGHWMVFTACDHPDGQGDCDLYMAEYVGGAWRNVRNLGPQVNTPGWESQPSISADGLSLYFVSDRPGGFGGTDIWTTTRAIGGEWTPAVNVGPQINTWGDEMSPYIAADDITLYFSSNGQPGLGGLDVYMTRYKNRAWTEPQNLGTPINSPQDDYFFSLQLGGDKIYFASNRPGGFGGLDLYEGVPNPMPPAPITTVIGSVLDSKARTPLGALLTVRNIETNEVVSTFHSDDMNGSYVVVLQPGRRYAITAESPGYLFYTDRFDVPRESPNNLVRKDVLMTRDVVRLLVFFDFNKASLQSDSYVDLDRAVQWLKDNPSVTVELAGHTDNIGAREYNQKLSSDRARSVLDYLVSKGIPPSRLKAQGYGMDQPITSNDTEEGRAQNRRVEFRVQFTR
jgi:outer membrane protein OmpA-like peptidoglycan-associated protein